MLTLPSRLTLVVTVLVAALSVVLGTTLALSPAGVAVPAGAGHARATDPTYNVPAVGVCFDYTQRDYEKRTNSSAAVPCTGPHTATTIATPLVKGRLTPKNAAKKALPTCQKALAATVGSAVARTAYTYGFFLPSKTDRKAGARWIRCDLVLRGGRSLAQLPTPLVTDPLSEAVTVCAVIVKGVTVRTNCAAKHDYRYAASVRAKGRYPGADKLLRFSILKCAPKVSNPKRFWSFYPSATQWKGGLREIACLSRTKA